MDVLVFIAVVVVVGLIMLFWVFSGLKKRGFSSVQKNEYLKYWSRIQSSDPRTAVMDADKLLDHMLSKKGYTGSLGEKLKKAGKLFRNPDDVWAAHKLRNRLAHELDIVFSEKQVKEALKKFEHAYRDLGLFS